MEKHRLTSLRCILAMIIAIVLVITGGTLLIHELKHYNIVVADNQDSYLLNSVRYVDKNLSIQLETYRTELAYVLNQVGFLRLEEAWLKNGNSVELAGRMRANLLAEDPSISCILAVRKDQIVLSSNGNFRYNLPVDYATAPISAVSDADGEHYLALSYSRGDVVYLALVDIAKYYALMQNALPVSNDRLFFYDTSDGHIVHQVEGTVMTTHIVNMPADHTDAAVVEAILLSETEGKPQTISYDYAPGGEKLHEARLAVIPRAELTNGIFAIGMSVDYSAMTAPLYSSMQRIIIAVLLTMVGVGVVILLAVIIAMSMSKRDRELESLHKKNQEMAELNERTLSLYHHQRLETIGTLTSSIAHEFGNLLTPIMGYSIMTMEALPPEYEDLADNLREIYEASSKAKIIISRLSDLSRKNTGASYVDVSPDELVHRMLSVAQPSIPEEVQVKLSLNAENARLHANETQISQMLLNLLLNACHAMASTGGTLSISTSVEGHLLRIRVSDTGIGIRPEHMEKIFDPFFTTREAGKGTGLGLSISQQVAREHGGDISVCSTLGQGATFNVILPLQE